jgi:hypothetical protein
MSKDPLESAPEVTVYDDPIEIAAREVAEGLVYFPNEHDHRTLHILGNTFNFSSIGQSKEYLAEARFRITRALVTFAFAERAKAANEKFLASLRGDA